MEYLGENNNLMEIVSTLIKQAGSLQQIHQLLSMSDNDPRALREALEVINNNELSGDSDDYHNISVCYARTGDYASACIILKKGISLFPSNSDLLADFIKYASKAGTYNECKEYYDKLKEVPLNAWTWRGFDFSIDYMIDLYSNAIDGSDEQKTIIEELKYLSMEFQRHFPFDEQAFLSEYAYLNAIGLKEEAVVRLGNVIDQFTVMPKSCLRYCDLMLERGEYEKVIEYAEKGIMGDAQSQSTIKTGYLFFVSALAKDALIWRDKKFNDEDAIRDLYLDYRIAERLDNNPNTSTRAIHQQIVLRTTIMGLKSGIPYENHEDTRNPNQEQHFTLDFTKEEDQLSNSGDDKS